MLHFYNTQKSLKLLIYQPLISYVAKTPHMEISETTDISTFFTLLQVSLFSLSIYRLFSKQGSGSIFLSCGSLRSKKSPPFSPCFPKFWRCRAVAKLNHTQNEVNRGSACSADCTAKTASSSVQEFALIFN